MIRAAAEHTTPEGSARKAWHSILYATGAYIYFRQQTGGGCLVVVKLASLVVLCGGHRPPTNATSQCFDGKGHTSNTTCSCPHYIYICVCLRYLEPTGLHESTRWESINDLDSSCLIMVCNDHGTKLCGMLITYVY